MPWKLEVGYVGKPSNPQNRTEVFVSRLRKNSTPNVCGGRTETNDVEEN
jgi:hypothetical protein